nr:cation-transporting P-type ATPase [Actinomycetota bacterium]
MAVTSRADAASGARPRRGSAAGKVPADRLADIPALDPADVLAALGTTARGLDAAQVAASRETAGANVLPAVRGRSVASELGARSE